jgi:hypothetical protein
MTEAPEPATAARSSKYEGWVPFLCVLGAILALGGSAITWVVSPNWGTGGGNQATVRNVGQIPTQPFAAALAAATIAPERIEIPRLSVNARIVRVRTLPDRQLDVPLDPKIVGWWENGAKPGAKKGTAILDGHINFNGVDGVLSKIGSLDPGDLVYVYGINAGKHTKVRFTVTGVRTYNKQALPFQEIFDQHSVGRLAIVTCGGSFDPSTGNYLDNIVAFAVPS